MRATDRDKSLGSARTNLLRTNRYRHYRLSWSEFSGDVPVIISLWLEQENLSIILLQFRSRTSHTEYSWYYWASQRICVPKKNVSVTKSASVFRWKGGRPPTPLVNDEIQWPSLVLPKVCNLSTFHLKKETNTVSENIWFVRYKKAEKSRNLQILYSTLHRPLQSNNSRGISKNCTLHRCSTPPTRFGLQWPYSARCLWEKSVIMSNYF
jgi:hypothetical protein